MRRFLGTAVIAIGSVLPLTLDSVDAVGFNTGMLYRYPWNADVTMTRTQAQGDADPSHHGALEYSVDWDNGTGNWLVLSANGGTLRCDDEVDQEQASFGNFIVVYNSSANQTATYAHLTTCGFYTAGVQYPITQGQGIGLAGCTGVCDGTHLHFHVVNGNVYTGFHQTVPFEMSDKSSFYGNQNTLDGPSDNAGVGYTGFGTIDQAIRDSYLANGGASVSWWNVGATLKTGLGPCVFSKHAFVHSCTTQHGVFVLQNYIRSGTNEPSTLVKNSAGTVAYKVRGAIWRSLGTAYRSTDVFTNRLGPPTGIEFDSGGKKVQEFVGGRIERYTDRVRQDGYVGSSGARRITSRPASTASVTTSRPMTPLISQTRSRC
jgi:hypothetical protein